MTRLSLFFLGGSLVMALLLLSAAPPPAEAGKSSKQLLAFALISLLNRSKKIVVPIPVPMPLPIPIVDKKKHYITKEQAPVHVPVNTPSVYHPIKKDGYSGAGHKFIDAVGDGSYGGGAGYVLSDEYGGHSSRGDGGY